MSDLLFLPQTPVGYYNTSFAPGTGTTAVPPGVFDDETAPPGVFDENSRSSSTAGGIPTSDPAAKRVRRDTGTAAEMSDTREERAALTVKKMAKVRRWFLLHMD